MTELMNCPHLGSISLLLRDGAGSCSLVLISQVIELHFLSCLAALQPDKTCLLFLDEFVLLVGGHTVCNSSHRQPRSSRHPLPGFWSRHGTCTNMPPRVHPSWWLSEYPLRSCARPQAVGIFPGQVWLPAASQDWQEFSRG